MKKRVGFCSVFVIIPLIFSCAKKEKTTVNPYIEVNPFNVEFVIEEDNIENNFVLTNYDGEVINGDDGVYTITSGVVYTATGKLDYGQIYVDAPYEEVEVDLDGVSITNNSYPPIYANDCLELVIKVKRGSINYIYDTRKTDYSDSNDEDAGSSAIYASNGNIKVNGNGKILIESRNNSGISSSDNVTVKNCTMMIKAKNNGIKGSDKVTIEEHPVLSIYAGNDGIKTTNSKMGEKSQHGNIYILGGNIIVNSDGDAIHAAYGVEFGQSVDEEGVIYRPIVDLYTNIYSNFSATTFEISERNSYDGMQECALNSSKGIKANELVNIVTGDVFIYANDDGIQVKQNTLDDGSTSSGNMTVYGGNILIKSDDDGIHTDGSFKIFDGEVTIGWSHEGIESDSIDVTGGETKVYAIEDGLNADTSILISGGRVDVSVPATGSCDGIDSNGTLTITGGTTIVRGPNAEMSSPIDCVGLAKISDGNLIIVGFVAYYLSYENLTKNTSKKISGKGEHIIFIGGEQITYNNLYDYKGVTTVFSKKTVVF